jgi:simple sugar transport system ATP-binding protein
MVHQHFALVDTFTALENVALGEAGWGKLNEAELHRRLQELIADTGLRVPLEVPVGELTVGERQRVEILKVLKWNVKVLILDEPTSVLTPVETEELFGFLRRLRDQGKAVIFITHKLKEVLAVTDRIVVLRQGRVVGEVQTPSTEAAELARMMVGTAVRLGGRRPVELSVQVGQASSLHEGQASAPAKEPKLSVEGLRVRRDTGALAVKDLSFSVYPGEIFGVAGVEGNGQTELVEAISGLRRAEGGRVKLSGQDVTSRPPTVLYRLGLAHVPEDRWKYGLCPSLSVAENSILGIQRTPEFCGPLLSLRSRRMHDHAKGLINRFQIQAQGSAPVKTLSGGNQQKLIVGRELSKDPQVVVAAQPTRGLDIEAAQRIRDLLLEMRDEGRAILLVSADLDEVLDLSDRVAFMYEGTFQGVFRPAELSPDEIGLLMGGAHQGLARGIESNGPIPQAGGL